MLPDEHPWVTCFVLSVLFVAPLHILVPAHIRLLSHSDPTQIKWRMSIQALVLSVMTIAIYLLYSNISISDVAKGDKGAASSTKADYLDVLKELGFKFDKIILATVKPLLLYQLLFLGPIVHQTLLLTQTFQQMPSLADLVDNFFPNFNSDSPIEMTRNMVVAPFAEEYVFRAMFAFFLNLNGESSFRIVLFSPLFFGVAHAHHAINHILAKRYPLQTILQSTILQMIYTTFFGWLEMDLYLKSGYLVSPVIVHSWCNLMGLPMIGYRLDGEHPLHSKKFIIDVAYVSGIVLFIALYNYLAIIN